LRIFDKEVFNAALSPKICANFPIPKVFFFALKIRWLNATTSGQFYSFKFF